MRKLPRVVWLLVLARAVNRLGAFTLPFLGLLLVRNLGAGLEQVGWLLAGFGLATITSRLLGGRLADAVGGRATLVAGLVGTASAQLLVAASSSLREAAVAVVLLGLAFEVYEPPSQAIVADVTPADQRPVAYGLLGAAMAAAGMGAGLLAAVLAGLDLRWLFVVDAGTGLLLTGVATTTAAYVGATVVWSLGDLLLLGRGYAVVAAIAPEHARGRYLAVHGTSWGVAGVVAPVLGTQLLAHGGPVLTWSVLAGLCVALAMAQPALRALVRA